MTTFYEVQYLDGFGAWRRWSLCRSVEATVSSMARLHERGIRSGRVRLVSKPS